MPQASLSVRADRSIRARGMAWLLRYLRRGNGSPTYLGMGVGHLRYPTAVFDCQGCMTH